MDAFVIEGGRPLRGRVRVGGSKNATLPQMAAALLTDERVVLRDAPHLADIENMGRLLGVLGCEVGRGEGERAGELSLRVVDDSVTGAPYEIVRTMRASICTLGPTLAKRGEARVALPGGCAIGDRPIDLHLRGMEALGANIALESGDIVARAPAGGRLRGATVFLGGPFGPTVLGTANVMSAATLAEGRTVIEGAACEPEIVDLASLLVKMGARIEGAGTPRVTVEGVERLGGAAHAVVPDRIVAGTFLIASAMTNSGVVLENFPADALLAALDTLRGVGVEAAVEEDDVGDAMRRTVRVSSERVLRPARVTTQPHPGFPTDLQAQTMALLCVADGNSVVTERIYEQRFLHVPELARMGAELHRQGPTVVVSGVRELVGAPVMASDLRASACLVLAGLAARGTTVIRRVYHLDRGYERMDGVLRGLGAEIERVDDRELGGGSESPVAGGG